MSRQRRKPKPDLGSEFLQAYKAAHEANRPDLCIKLLDGFADILRSPKHESPTNPQEPDGPERDPDRD